MKKLIYIFFIFIFLAFKADHHKSGYNVPISPLSVCILDIDLDNDKDIIFSHMYSFATEWSGISFLTNDGNAFYVMDSVYISDNHWDFSISNIDTNNSFDCVTQGYHNNSYAIVIYFDILDKSNNIHYLYLNYYPDFLSLGDINGDSFDDIVFCNNLNKIWGIAYNDGYGNFSSPQYYDITFPPSDILTADLNKDGRDDIIIGGKVEILFSKPDGFQSFTTDVIINRLEIADLDKDGDLDIIGAINMFPTSYHKRQIIENIGDEDFIIHESIYFEPFCDFQFVASDFNNDSLPDLLFHTFDKQNLMLFYNEGELTFSESAMIPITNYGESIHQSACADLDGNGYNDIVTIRGWGAPLPANVNIFFNDGDGNFVENPFTAIEETDAGNSEKMINCYPNPFKNKTNIAFEIDKTLEVKISIFNINGKEIKTLTNKKYQSGNYSIVWNAKDQNGKEVNSGLYFIHIQLGSEAITKRVLLVK